MAERIGYDELLESRVKQLQEIDDVVAAIRRYCAIDPSSVVAKGVIHRLDGLREDLAEMIRVAKAESAAF